jgi:hypothetical protein
MEKSVSQDESYEDIQSLQQKAGELDRYARGQLMQENILEAFAMFEKSSIQLMRFSVPYQAFWPGFHRVQDIFRHDYEFR